MANLPIRFPKKETVGYSLVPGLLILSNSEAEPGSTFRKSHYKSLGSERLISQKLLVDAHEQMMNNEYLETAVDNRQRKIWVKLLHGI